MWYDTGGGTVEVRHSSPNIWGTQDKIRLGGGGVKNIIIFGVLY